MRSHRVPQLRRTQNRLFLLIGNSLLDVSAIDWIKERDILCPDTGTCTTGPESILHLSRFNVEGTRTVPPGEVYAVVV